jgi:hypothetical protein
LIPIPELEYRNAAESYLATLAPAFGRVLAIHEPLGTYPLHRRSLSHRTLVTDRIVGWRLRNQALHEGFRKVGIKIDISRWFPDDETRQLVLDCCAEMSSVVPAGSRFLFVEWNQWGPGCLLPDCEAIPFLEKDGEYWGRPVNSAMAIEELERLRRGRATHIVLAHPALWWLDYYDEFAFYLRSHFRCTLETTRLVIFDLRN